jgi:hypothetical protein
MMGSGKAGCSDGGADLGISKKSRSLDAASMRISLLVITQSTSLAPFPLLFPIPPVVKSIAVLLFPHTASVNSSLLASSFLSKHGIIARCHILLGGIPSIRLRVVFSSVPVSACGDFTRER